MLGGPGDADKEIVTEFSAPRAQRGSDPLYAEPSSDGSGRTSTPLPPQPIEAVNAPGLWASVVLSGVASIISVNFIHPIELVKTRIQVPIRRYSVLHFLFSFPLFTFRLVHPGSLNAHEPPPVRA